MLKQQITEFCKKYYKGSLRFLKDKMFIDNFGGTAYETITTYNTFLTEDQPLSVKVYNYLNNISTQPVCKTCGVSVKFNSTKGWMTYCSVNCRSKDSSVVDKRKTTNIVKYGVTNFLASEQGKKKSQESHLRKYGETHYNKTQEYVDRHKTGDIVRSFDREKYRTTVRTKFYNNLNEIVPNLTPLFSLDFFVKNGAGSYYQYDWLCNVCNHTFQRWLNIGLRPICPRCSPKGTAHELMLKAFLDRYNIPYVFRSRKILDKNLELDVYIPSKNIAIEIDGLFYHKEQNVGKHYHLDKTTMAQKKGIRLIHIFGDEFHRKCNVVFYRLKHILGVTHRSIYARECVVQTITPKQKSKFLNKYHIQGDGNGSIHLGLFHRQRLIAVMEFGKQRPSIGKQKCDESIELIRFATIAHFNVVGGAGKLLSHFKKLKIATKIVSFADRRWSTGDLYEKLGFTLAKTSGPNYWYTRNFTERLHRVGFQRSQLSTKLASYDATQTEQYNMLQNGFHRVWDCGTLRYELMV